MLKIIGFIILASSLTALFVFYHYSVFKAIESRSKWSMCPLYFRIVVRLFLLIGGLYFLWTAQFSDLGSVLPLAYIFVSLVISILLLRKIRSGRIEAQRRTTKEN